MQLRTWNHSQAQACLHQALNDTFLALLFFLKQQQPPACSLPVDAAKQPLVSEGTQDLPCTFPAFHEPESASTCVVACRLIQTLLHCKTSQAWAFTKSQQQKLYSSAATIKPKPLRDWCPGARRQQPQHRPQGPHVQALSPAAMLNLQGLQAWQEKAAAVSWSVPQACWHRLCKAIRQVSTGLVFPWDSWKLTASA